MRLLPLLLLLFGCRPPVPPPMAGGIHINEPDLVAYGTALKAAGLDSLQVTAYARQMEWDGAAVDLEKQDPQEVTFQLDAAEEAGLKSALVLRTYLEHGVAKNRHLWHGMIWPSDQDLDAWFDSYRDYALWGARLAKEHGADLLVLANELNSMTSTLLPEGELGPYEYFLDPERTAKVRDDLVRCAEQVEARDLSWLDGGTSADLDAVLSEEDAARRAWTVAATGGGDRDAMRARLGPRLARMDSRWRGIIRDVRRIYRGPVSLGANFDSYDRVGFWDELDAIGVTSYFKLRLWGEEGAAQEAALLDGWRGVAAGLQAVALERPVYLLELGWTRKAGSTVRPWSYDRVEVLETVGEVEEGAAQPLTCVHWRSQPEDSTERARALEALNAVVREGGFPSLRGFSLWKLTTRDYHWAGEPFAIQLPAAVQDGAVRPEDVRLLEAAAELGRLLK